MSQAADDPGWPGVGSVLLMMLPGVRLWQMRRTRAGDPLLLLRTTFSSFSIALVGFGIVLAILPGAPNGPVVPWVPILVVFAAGSVVGVEFFRRRPLDCGSEATLSVSYRSRFFVIIALTEAVTHSSGSRSRSSAARSGSTMPAPRSRSSGSGRRARRPGPRSCATRMFCARRAVTWC